MSSGRSKEISFFAVSDEIHDFMLSLSWDTAIRVEDIEEFPLRVH